MRVLSLTEESASIELDEQAVNELFDALYEATDELQPRDKLDPDLEPVKIEEHQVVDPKSNKVKTKKLYFYHQTVPRGGFLDRRDKSQNKVHVELWRDVIWQIMRGIDKQRNPFKERAAGKQPSDGVKTWAQLSLNAEKSIGLKSTYFIGAQDTNAEGVSFHDKVKYQFLLHFWTYIAQIYVPQLVDRDGKHTYDGFCIAVPDVSSLKSFCEDFDLVLQQRRNDPTKFRPREFVISIPAEAGLDALRRMANVVQQSSGQSQTGDLVVGVDVLHTRKDGNNVRLLYAGRVEPVAKRDTTYAAIAKNLLDFWFRRQRIINLIKGLDWFDGFDALLTELPLEQGLLSKSFAQDARTCFRVSDEQHKAELSMQLTSEKVCLESLVLKIVDSYLKRKLADKYELEWSKLGTKEEQRNYSDKKHSLATECFYAVRSRNSKDDFINYFASTICSVPQWMSSKEYLSITQELYGNTDKIRTLTMLALSARIERGDDKDEGKENKDNG
jgi:CRISPR-associated protein Cmx8